MHSKYMHHNPIHFIVSRLLSAWFILSIFNSFSTTEYLSIDYIQKQSLPIFLIRFAAIFIIISLFCVTSRTVIWTLWISSTLYSLKILSLNNDSYVLAGICICQFFLFYYYKNRLSFDVFHKGFRKYNNMLYPFLLALLIIGVGAFIIITTLCRYELSSSTTFDFGIFAQMFYNMRNDLSMVTTCERSGPMSHLHVHTSLFYYLLLPVYYIFPANGTLLVLQGLSIVVGFYPLLLLCRHFNLTKRQSFMFAIIYCLAPATLGGCFYDFHENVFLIPLLLSMFYCFEKGYTKRTLLFALLVCSVKEDATLFVIVFALYVLISGKNIKQGLSLLAIGGAWMFFAFRYLSTNGEGLMTDHYSNLSGDNENGLIGILTTLLTNPGYLITQIFLPDNIPFLIAVLAPLLTLPFATRKYKRFILLLPFIFINLLTDYQYQHSVFYQYVFAPFMFLIYLALQNAAELPERSKRAQLLLCAICTILAFTSQISGKVHYFKSYTTQKEQRQELQEMYDFIPKDSSVSASTFFVPKLAKRQGSNKPENILNRIRHIRSS